MVVDKRGVKLFIVGAGGYLLTVNSMDSRNVVVSVNGKSSPFKSNRELTNDNVHSYEKTLQASVMANQLGQLALMGID